MVDLKKYYREAFAVIGINILFFATRLYNILSLPIFTDEAIYVRWAQIAGNDAAWRFISLTDGKQPLFIWMTVVFMQFIDDPLLAGRLVSVFAGFATMVGLFLLARTLFQNRWIGILSAFLYAIYPFALVYDKMALYDSLVGTFAVWGLYMVVLFVRFNRLDTALLLGMTAGFGALNKTNGFFTIYLLPFALLLFDTKAKKGKLRFLKWVGLSFIAVILTYGIYSVLRLSPFFHIIEQKNATFVYPFKEWIKHPFTYFWGNLWIGQRDWLLRYFGVTFLLLTMGAFVIKRDQWREKTVLALWFVLPFVGLALFGNTLYPRYIFFMTLSLLPLVAYTLYYLPRVLKNKYVFGMLVLCALAYPLFVSYYVLFNFALAPIPSSDRNQYNNDWPSGYGVKESIAFLRLQDGEKIALFTQGTFGLMPYAYEIYLHDNPKFLLKGVWPIGEEALAELKASAATMPTYIVFYQPCIGCPGKGIAPESWKLKEVFKVQKPAYDAFLTVYQVLPQ